jgi:hypothetical protein
VFQFVLTLLTTVLLIPAIFVMPGSGLGRFYHSAWFWIPGGILLAVGLFGALMGLGRRSRLGSRSHRSSLVGHLGVVLLFIGLLRETRAIDGIVMVREGETATTLSTEGVEGSRVQGFRGSGGRGTELPLGFELALASFQEQGYVSRVRINSGPETRIAPSHPISSHGWLVLQEASDRDTAQGWLRLVTESDDTVRANLGERVQLPRTGFEMVFDLNPAQTRDTMFRFRLFEDGVEKPSGFISRKGIIPPSLKLGLRLIDFETGRRYVSILRVVKRPGAGLVFFAFAVLLAGVLMFALEPRRYAIDGRR